MAIMKKKKQSSKGKKKASNPNSTFNRGLKQADDLLSLIHI